MFCDIGSFDSFENEGLKGTASKSESEKDGSDGERIVGTWCEQQQPAF
jgi:hypothetical protein